MTMMRLPIRGVMGVVFPAILMILTACQSDSSATGSPVPEATPTPTAAVQADAVQTLRVNLPGEPQTLDPQRSTDSVSNTILRSIYSGLLRVGPDLTVQPDLAMEVPTVENGGISADGLTYTFRLREGLKWSDGTPLVAGALVDSARRLFEPGATGRYADFYRVLASPGPDGDANLAVRAARRAGATADELLALEALVQPSLRVEAPDDRTVVYHLNTSTPVFLQLAAMWPLYPVRQDVITAHGAQWPEAATHISNGPFRLAEGNTASASNSSGTSTGTAKRPPSTRSTTAWWARPAWRCWHTETTSLTSSRWGRRNSSRCATTWRCGRSSSPTRS